MKSLIIFFALFGLFASKEWEANESGKRACEKIESDSNFHKKCTVANMNLGDGFRCCFVEGQNYCQYFPDDGDEIKKRSKEIFNEAKVDCSSSKIFYNIFFGLVLFAMVL